MTNTMDPPSALPTTADDILLPALMLGDPPETCTPVRLSLSQVPKMTISDLREVTLNTLGVHSLSPRDILRTRLYDVSQCRLPLTDARSRARLGTYKRSEDVNRILPEGILLNPVQRLCDVDLFQEKWNGSDHLVLLVALPGDLDCSLDSPPPYVTTSSTTRGVADPVQPPMHAFTPPSSSSSSSSAYIHTKPLGPAPASAGSYPTVAGFVASNPGVAHRFRDLQRTLHHLEQPPGKAGFGGGRGDRWSYETLHDEQDGGGNGWTRDNTENSGANGMPSTRAAVAHEMQTIASSQLNRRSKKFDEPTDPKSRTGHLFGTRRRRILAVSILLMSGLAIGLLSWLIPKLRHNNQQNSNNPSTNPDGPTPSPSKTILPWPSNIPVVPTPVIPEKLTTFTIPSLSTINDFALSPDARHLFLSNGTTRSGGTIFQYDLMKRTVTRTYTHAASEYIEFVIPRGNIYLNSSTFFRLRYADRTNTLKTDTLIAVEQYDISTGQLLRTAKDPSLYGPFVSDTDHSAYASNDGSFVLDWFDTINLSSNNTYQIVAFNSTPPKLSPRLPITPLPESYDLMFVGMGLFRVYNFNPTSDDPPIPLLMLGGDIFSQNKSLITIQNAWTGEILHRQEYHFQLHEEMSANGFYLSPCTQYRGWIAFWISDVLMIHEVHPVVVPEVPITPITFSRNITVGLASTVPWSSIPPGASLRDVKLSDTYLYGVLTYEVVDPSGNGNWNGTFWVTKWDLVNGGRYVGVVASGAYGKGVRFEGVEVVDGGVVASVVGNVVTVWSTVGMAGNVSFV